jgi:two-component system OmpR family response regulator
VTNPTKKLESVLLVDDDANIRLIIEISLEGLTDWKLRQADSGRKALELMCEQRPDLVLLDVMMPEMDGITMLERIKERFADEMPFVIFMTAKVQEQELEQYMSLGAAGVIMKPFDPMTLAKQITDILSSCVP